MSEIIDSVNVISINEVHDEIYGDIDPYSDRGLELLTYWLEANECTFYAQCSEDFFVFEAVRQAQAKGLYCVLVENLS
jgi:DNA polymerase elongation subunit (family B)